MRCGEDCVKKPANNFDISALASNYFPDGEVLSPDFRDELYATTNLSGMAQMQSIKLSIVLKYSLSIIEADVFS